ncbi:SGNH hydrolase-type esterase domain-containing protein [Hypoxylon crocopeplum]|nr:SGNH hydrolase-type esterase domain-containing protein [Hypoxylon crocopeplum]
MSIRSFVTLLIGIKASLAVPLGDHLQLDTRDVDIDPILAVAIAVANITPYAAPSSMQRDITDWLAIGDSFSAGISADVESDELNSACKRFKKSYPYQMNEDPRFPGHATSRTFAFGSCSGATTKDILDNQIELGRPDPDAVYTPIGNPQIATVSLSGNDLKFGDIVNACILHWMGYGDCSALLKSAHQKLDDPGHAFEFELVSAFARILVRGRTANPNFQLFVTGYLRFWDDQNPQCDTVSWAPSYRSPVYLKTTLRQDMNSLVLRLNDVLRKVVDNLNRLEGGVYFVDEFEQKFDGHRFCEVEQDPNYHKKPIDQRTWFIHYQSPYPSHFSATEFDNRTFFEVVDSILIPPKDGKSTEEQIQAVNGDLAALNPAYESVDSMTAALEQLAQSNDEFVPLPITWTRLMHPKGSGYKAMSDAVIDKILQYSATGAPAGPVCPQQQVECNTCTGVNFSCTSGQYATCPCKLTENDKAVQIDYYNDDNCDSYLDARPVWWNQFPRAGADDIWQNQAGTGDCYNWDIQWLGAKNINIAGCWTQDSGTVLPNGSCRCEFYSQDNCEGDVTELRFPTPDSKTCQSSAGLRSWRCHLPAHF